MTTYTDLTLPKGLDDVKKVKELRFFDRFARKCRELQYQTFLKRGSLIRPSIHKKILSIEECYAHSANKS
jgi:hypothetical protein